MRMLLISNNHKVRNFIHQISERPVLVEKSSQKASTKHPKVRKRDNLAALLRERNPEKVPKLLQEIAKLSNVPIRRAISRYSSQYIFGSFDLNSINEMD